MSEVQAEEMVHAEKMVHAEVGRGGERGWVVGWMVV
jgi:hypothetical protein